MNLPRHLHNENRQTLNIEMSSKQWTEDVGWQNHQILQKTQKLNEILSVVLPQCISGGKSSQTSISQLVYLETILTMHRKTFRRRKENVLMQTIYFCNVWQCKLLVF